MEALPIDIDYYGERVTALREMLRNGTSTLVLAESRFLVEQFLAEASTWLNVTVLEQEVAVQQDFDLDALQAVLAQLKSSGLDSMPLPGARVIDPGEQLKQFEDALVALRAEHTRLGRTELGLRITYVLDRPLRNLLILAAHRKIELPEIVSLVRSKLASCGDVMLMKLWDRVLQEFDDTLELPHLSASSAALPPNFLSFGDPAELRDRLAKYVIEVRPALINDLMAHGTYTYPLDGPSAAALLTAAVRPDPWRRDWTISALARCISRLSGMWCSVLKGKAEEFAALVQAEDKSRLVRGIYAQEVRSLLSQADDQAQAAAVLSEIAHLLQLTARRGRGIETSVEATLRRYKLGLEVALPESAKALKNKDELYLQRHVARFMIERGIFAYGTKFGQFETDLFASNKDRSYVVEVKLCKENSHLAESRLCGHLSQLVEYMDKTLKRPQGVLLLYNFAGPIVIAPETWIHGRYLILPINLGVEKGSRRNQSVEIEEASDSHLITVTANRSRLSRTAL